jgi:hypothetical protein
MASQTQRVWWYLFLALRVAFLVLKRLIGHVTWKVLQFAEELFVKVKFAPWNWDETGWEVWQARWRIYLAPLRRAMHMSSRNPITFDCIIHPCAMKNACAAGEIIYGHSDFRSDLHSTQCFRTPSLPTFSGSRVNIRRWYLSLGGGVALRSFIFI